MFVHLHLQNNATVNKMTSGHLRLHNCRQNQPPHATYIRVMLGNDELLLVLEPSGW